MTSHQRLVTLAWWVNRLPDYKEYYDKPLSRVGYVKCYTVIPYFTLT